MEPWSKQQRAFAVKAFYQCGSYTAALRRFRTHFEIDRNRAVPSVTSVKSWVENFENTGETTRRKRGSARTVRTPTNIERVRVAVGTSPRRSVRRHSAALGMSTRSVRRMLRLDLHFHPYKLQVVQALNDTDFAGRRQFCETLLRMIEGDDEFVHNLWMSDEAHFHLSGYVNKQNFRYWSNENPYQLHQRPLHSTKVTVWCALSSMGIIGPFFFEDERGHAVTVNANRYSEMLRSFFIPKVRELGLTNETFFQQDGATSHTARASMTVVNNFFTNRVISRNGAIPWPSRSPDLTACDFFCGAT